MHCIYGVYLCTIRMQVGAAVVERAKSRRCINASQKSEVYRTIGAAAYCSRVGSNMVPLRAGGIQVRKVRPVSALCISGTYISGYIYKIKSHWLPFPVISRRPYLTRRRVMSTSCPCSGAYKETSHSSPRKVKAVSILIPISGVEEYSAALPQM